MKINEKAGLLAFFSSFITPFKQGAGAVLKNSRLVRCISKQAAQMNYFKAEHLIYNTNRVERTEEVALHGGIYSITTLLQR